MQNKFEVEFCNKKENLLDEPLLIKLSLEPNKIKTHQQRIYNAVNNLTTTTIPVANPCTINNFGVVPVQNSVKLNTNTVANLPNKSISFKKEQYYDWLNNNVVTFIPAAGAASRYLAELHKAVSEFDKVLPLLKDIITKKIKISPEIREEIDDKFGKIRLNETILKLPELLKAQKFAEVKNKWAEIYELFHGGNISYEDIPHASLLSVYSACHALLEKFDGVSKALVPTTLEGDTFLDLKFIEQSTLIPTKNNILVVAAGLKQNFELLMHSKNIQWKIMEQGVNLSTIRFNSDASPYLDNSKYSLVAAGHGELVNIFKDVAQHNSDLNCIHIRNIDNVIGNIQEKTDGLNLLASNFYLLRNVLEKLRLEVDNILRNFQFEVVDRINSEDLYMQLAKLCEILPKQAFEFLQSESFNNPSCFLGVTPNAIFEICNSVFYWNVRFSPDAPLKDQWEIISVQLSKPLSVMGVVQKEPLDVGGGPVFAKLSDGQTIKLCMEMPHADKDDAQKYFGVGGDCTHFNPVLVFFELQTHSLGFQGEKIPGRTVDFAKLYDDRFWLLAKKDYQGKTVCYHETVLYELLGNSATTNLVFVEVGRNLFNPHKTIFESLTRSRSHYGFK